MSVAATLSAPNAKTGRKKMVIIVLAVLLLLLAAAAGGLMVLKARAAAQAQEDEEDEVQFHVQLHRPRKGVQQAGAFDPKRAPVFVQMEAITINLADRDADRYAQVGIALEVESKAAEQIKAFLPVIRNNLLMAVANKTSDDVRTDEGRRLLAAELQARALLPLGVDVDVEDLLEGVVAYAGAGKGTLSRRPVRLPIKAVHFVNFIVQ